MDKAVGVATVVILTVVVRAASMIVVMYASMGMGVLASAVAM
jgi:hypothetical protein